MVTSPYEWNILEWDDNKTNKHIDAIKKTIVELKIQYDYPIYYQQIEHFYTKWHTIDYQQIKDILLRSEASRFQTRPFKKRYKLKENKEFKRDYYF